MVFFLYGNVDSVGRKIIGYEREFRDYIGKWTYISVAYHKQFEDSSNKVYFPRMIKFEINTNSIEADPKSITKDPIFNQIIINKGYYGLFAGIKFYKEYIIQSITFENKNFVGIDIFTKPGLLKPNNEASESEIGLKCNNLGIYTYDANDYQCVPEDEPDVGSF